MICKVLIFPLISSSSSLFELFGTVPGIATIIGIIVTFMFHSFFSSLSKHLFIFLLSFISILWSAGTAKSTKLQFPFFFFFFFFLRSSLLAGIEWFIYISKSQRILYILFPWMDSSLCTYHLVVWLNFNHFHNSQWMTLSTQSCLIFYSFSASLLHSLIKWSTALSLSSHHIHLKFCCVLLIFPLI